MVLLIGYLSGALAAINSVFLGLSELR